MRLPAVVGLVAVLSLFCAPLFVGLGGWDLRSDEAIYAYSIDRILETSEWLTPRSIQVDGPFLEKPPLKLWMAAAAIQSGLVPHDETGFRLLDALMGAMAFAYVYLIGLRLAGPICGVVAVFMTFSMNAVLFEHGLRSNNMEAALVLAYCGGMYHFVRWADARRPLPHALVAGGFFVLGFMTKFVAALFLPIVCALATVVAPDVRRRVLEGWRDWVTVAILVVAATAPWFVYEWLLHGSYFIEVIFGTHVYQRFTASLDPSHLEPWHFYFSRTWTELAGARLATVLALAAVGAALWRGQNVRLGAVLIWWLAPLLLMSFGTSKLFHYAYPFLPPLALLIGWAAAKLFAVANGTSGRRLAHHVQRMQVTSSGLARNVLAAAAIGAVSLALITAIGGRVVWWVGDTRLMQNSSTLRPLLVGALLFALAGRSMAAVNALAVAALAISLPISGYTRTASRMTSVDAPLRVIRDCAASVALTRADRDSGVYNTARVLSHSVYYYFHRLGAWTESHSEAKPEEELERRLFDEDRQSLVVMTSEGYEQLRRRAAAHAITSLPPAGIVEGVVVVMPGPFSGCAAAARAAGAQPPAPRS